MPFGKCLESKRPFSKRRKLNIDCASVTSSADVTDQYCLLPLQQQGSSARGGHTLFYLTVAQIRWNHDVQQMSFISGLMLSSPLGQKGDFDRV